MYQFSTKSPSTLDLRSSSITVVFIFLFPFFLHCTDEESAVATTMIHGICRHRVLESKIMNTSGPGSGSILNVIHSSLANEEPMSMFKGWLPAWALDTSPVNDNPRLSHQQLKRAANWKHGTL
ncbi:hypothetical protein J3A83DRAFT_988707 [Scleroderma citrinum]